MEFFPRMMMALMNLFQTSAPVEIEVNGSTPTKVEGDEVIETNLEAYKGYAIHFWSFN